MDTKHGDTEARSYLFSLCLRASVFFLFFVFYPYGDFKIIIETCLIIVFNEKYTGRC